MEHGHNGIEAAAASQPNHVLERHQQSMQEVGSVTVHDSLQKHLVIDMHMRAWTATAGVQKDSMC